MEAIVVGAGLGGLSAAAHLRASGYDVTIFEKNEMAGGKMSEVRSAGYRFDSGPSLITMPFVLEELFTALGTTLEQHIDLIALDTICRYHFADGTSVDAFSDLPRFQNQIASLAEEDAPALMQYLQYSREIYELTAPVFLEQSVHEFSSYQKLTTIKALLSAWKLDAWRTVHEANASFFRSPKVVQIFDRYATYSGSNPYLAPATLNVIPHVEYTLGSYYIRGGIFRLAESIIELLKDRGVSIQFRQPVARVLSEQERVVGVELESGEKVLSDVVIMNADTIYAAQSLIEDRTINRLALEPSCSGVVFLWGVSRKYSQLSHHSIFFAEDYEREFKEIFQELRYPSDPTVYVSCTSRSDSSHAPDGCDNLFALINVPYMHGSRDFGSEIERLKIRVLAKLERAGLADLSSSIVFERVISPVDLWRRYNANAGSIYRISSNSKWSAFNRPANRSRSFRGLYYVGGAAHPGGGVPLVIRSGKIAAELVVQRR
jgi:phytoene desaturase